MKEKDFHSRMKDLLRKETLMSIEIHEIRARNIRIAEMYLQFKKSL
jgi:hypothetical protein